MVATEPAQPGRFEIQPLVPGDAEALCPLQIEAGWNQVAADWHLMLNLGQGFGVKGTDGRWIASALALPLGPAIAWLSMVLVTEAARRQGLGKALLARVLAEVEASGAAVGLDATELGRPIYLSLGFRDAYPLSRWHAGSGARQPVAPPDGITVRVAGPEHVQRMADFDCPRSCFERTAVLEHLLTRAPPLARVAERADGSLVGYALGRDGYRSAHVGPVVADDAAVGVALLGSAFAATEAPLIVDVPDSHAAVRAWLASQGASAPRGFMRMLRGDGHGAERAAYVFALAGPELA